ncbi:hypothetical protein [Paraburkholderia caledonica]|uniref:Uncharacterized protein n=1 Tax=Paraburkholderia caledonica TaxID=134536 RepID=A0ABU1KYR7_9BURK|nr:hypothetical protein [Paraburkholderia caledonica]MDR6376082.1 hypothetical protein [Paraburkholderia caledonica]
MKAERPAVRFSSSFGLLVHEGSTAVPGDRRCLPTDASVLFAAVKSHGIENESAFESGCSFRASCFEDSGSDYVEMTFEIAGQHITWLADGSDAEVWEACASWARQGCVYVDLRGPHESVLHCVPSQALDLTLSRPWSTLKPGDLAAKRNFLYFATGIADSSLIHASVPEIIYGQPLRCVSVNVLLTESTKPLISCEALFREHDALSKFLRD